MGRQGGRNNTFLMRQQAEQTFNSSIHRARITALHINKGEMEVQFERYPAYARTVPIPLMGLSIEPLKPGEANITNAKTASWGRYIPQIGAMVYIGFSPFGDPYCLGYGQVYYEGLDRKEKILESVGGIGWGEASGKRLRPGDWDFKSSRRCSLYLGDKVSIASGSSTLLLDKRDNTLTTIAGLCTNRSGTGVETRQGDVRRRVLPTDAEETQMPSTIPGYQLFNGQEATMVIRTASTNPAFATTGQEMARLSLGDVYDDTGIPNVSITGGLTRAQLAVKDDSGFVDMFNMTVDSLGGLGMMILGRTQITSTLSFLLTASVDATLTIGTTLAVTTGAAMTLTSSATMGLTSSGTMSLTAPLIQLGGSAAVQPAVLGTSYSTMLTSFTGAMLGASATVVSAINALSTTPVAPIIPPLVAWFTSYINALIAMNSDITNTLSTTVMVK